MFEHLFSSEGGAHILMGRVGWDDEDEYYFLGTNENDGHTFVRVQLLHQGNSRGRPNAHEPESAQGYKIVCHLSGGLFRIPKKGTRVFVAIQQGMEAVPGAGVIFATVEKAPPQSNGDRAVLDFGDDHHVVIRGKSVAIQSAENEFVSVGTPRSGGTSGVTIQTKDGTGAVFQNGVVGLFVAQDGDAKTIIQMTTDKIEVVKKGGGYMRLNDAGFYTLGESCWVTGGAVYLGKAPTVANGALWGPTGIAGVMSTSVYISPA